MHNLKYSLALVAARRCVLRYDNEAPAGVRFGYRAVHVDFTLDAA